MQFTLFVTLCLSAFAVAMPIANSVSTLQKRDPVDFYDPRAKGGGLLNRSGSGGEPLNVIISGKSSPEVLTQDGFLNFVRAIGFSKECFGQHIGDPQLANLGDGNGWKGEREVLREHYTIPVLGTCLQSLVGGNHLRTYRQDGSEANSGALFLAVSEEEDLSEHHMIAPDGYNIGRDDFVNRAVGKKRFWLKTYTTTVTEIRDLLAAGAQGVNHGIAQDGVIKMLTVKVGGLFG